MARWAKRALRSLAGSAILGIVVAGCNKQDDPNDPRNIPVPENPGLPLRDPPPAEEKTSAKPQAFDKSDPLHQPMAQAVRTSDDPPPGTDLPVDTTMAGASTFRILKKVQDSWETIRFKTPDGQAIEYTAILETDLGQIEIELRPDIAPNHVRSFVALAQAGYYNGLTFDRMQFQESEGEEGAAPVRLEQIEAGNPQGVEKRNGSIGYWLLPEFNTKLPHEPGTVGACLEGVPDENGRAPADSAGCRFYITLTKDPLLDGNFTAFGKEKTGLEIARRIYARPVVGEDREREVRRPENPVVIKKVTIQTRVAGSAQGAK